MKKKNKISSFFQNNLAFLVVLFVGILCLLFLIFGEQSYSGYITLNGKDAKIEEYTKKFIEDSNEALYRIMNEDKPTDENTIEENDGEGLGFYTTIESILSRRLEDGNNDNGLGWQCSKYTAYLATGKREYSSVHPDYGPVNGKAIAEWLVKNYGFKYIDKPVKGAIGSGGFNTLYGHTAMYLYSTGDNTAMVNDANYVPLTVSTHNMNISGWVWVVPNSYNPSPEPSPEPVPSGDSITYTYVKGDYFSKVLINLGLDEGNLWGENGAVVYYTNQLIEQNMLDNNGNVKIGEPFKLIKR